MKRNLKIVFHQEAKEDLVRIEKYVLNISRNIIITAKTIEKIKNSINSILPYPNGYPLITGNHYCKYEIRRKICNKYIIYFINSSEYIEIIGIFHSRRSIKNVISEIIDRINE